MRFLNSIGVLEYCLSSTMTLAHSLKILPDTRLLKTMSIYYKPQLRAYDYQKKPAGKIRFTRSNSFLRRIYFTWIPLFSSPQSRRYLRKLPGTQGSFRSFSSLSSNQSQFVAFFMLDSSQTPNISLLILVFYLPAISSCHILLVLHELITSSSDISFDLWLVVLELRRVGWVLLIWGSFSCCSITFSSLFSLRGDTMGLTFVVSFIQIPSLDLDLSFSFLSLSLTSLNETSFL